MSIDVECAGCSKSLRLAEKFSGKTIRCPACGDPIQVIEEYEPPRRKKSSGSRSGRSEKSRSRSESALPRRPKKRTTKRTAASQNNQLPLVIGGVVLLALVGFGAYWVGLSDDTSATASNAPIPPANPTPSPGQAMRRERERIAAEQLAAQQRQLAAAANNRRANTSRTSARQGSNFNSPPPGYNSSNSNNSSGSTSFPPNGMASSGGNSRRDSAAPPADSPPPSSGDGSSVTNRELSLPDLIAAVQPSVVRVDVRSSQGLSNGSGFIVDDQGTVVTNYHVIAGAISATAVLDGKKTVKVLGYTHIDRKRDIAIIRVAMGENRLPALKLIQSTPRTGESVVAIGAPLGLDLTATEGIVSSTRTAAELEHAIGLANHEGMWVQTTAPVSPGNSGGPLVNRKGQVVAINTMVLTTGQNLNFGISAMDINAALRQQKSLKRLSPVSLPEMEEDGRVREVDIVGTPEAQEFLGRIRKMHVLMAAFAADPRGVVIGNVRSEALKAIEGADIMPGGRDSTAIMVIVMDLTPSGGNGAHELRITASIRFIDETSAARKVYKIWEEGGSVGTLSLQSLYNGVVPRRLGSDIRKFFGKLRGEVRRAKAKKK